MDRKKIGVIVQRYGLEVNGGAEYLARVIAERLALKYDVTVLTTRAIDYQKWKPEYPEGETEVNGIKVKRFNNTERIECEEKNYLDRKFRERHIPQKLHKFLGRPRWFTKVFPKAEITLKDGARFLEFQGPGTPDLVEYVKKNEHLYDAFVLFSAVYYPTALSVLAVPEKSILVPTMHDERPSYYPIFQQVMSQAKWLFFSTRAEQKFSEHLFPIKNSNKRIVAVGIDPGPENIDVSVPAKFNLRKPYIVYVGRIDSAKGCDVLIPYFSQFVKETKADIQLVLVGKLAMEVPNEPFLVFTGFVSEEEKEQLMKQAEALVIPSVYESLSLVLLESFACKVPVVTSANAEVMKDHIDDSKGGWSFSSYDDFKRIMTEILNDTEGNKQKGEAGFAYAINNYSWQKVMQQYDEAIEDITKNK